MRTFTALPVVLMLCLAGVVAAPAHGEGPLDEEGRLVQFERDIVPIFRDHCLECHGPQEQKGDFRIDDPDSISNYVEAGDVELSSLYVDYMASMSEDERMPPTAHDKPLSVAQLALVRTWISEGAHWPEGAKIESLIVTTEDVRETLAEPEAFAARFWAFQGFFHPATVHFPIALLFVGGLFVVLGLYWPQVGTQVPLACLLLGAVSSVVASLMGWSFATQRGYGSMWFDPDKEIFWHRWSGVAVSVVAVILALIALRALRRPSVRLERAWKIGLVVLAAMSGLVGHQGGELHYGKEFYSKAFQKLLGSQDDASTSLTKPGQEEPLHEHDTDY